MLALPLKFLFAKKPKRYRDSAGLDRDDGK
jgi:hypothetical protein